MMNYTEKPPTVVPPVEKIPEASPAFLADKEKFVKDVQILMDMLEKSKKGQFQQKPISRDLARQQKTSPGKIDKKIQGYKLVNYSSSLPFLKDVTHMFKDGSLMHKDAEEIRITKSILEQKTIGQLYARFTELSTEYETKMKNIDAQISTQQKDFGIGNLKDKIENLERMIKLETEETARIFYETQLKKAKEDFEVAEKEAREASPVHLEAERKQLEEQYSILKSPFLQELPNIVNNINNKGHSEMKLTKDMFEDFPYIADLFFNSYGEKRVRKIIVQTHYRNITGEERSDVCFEFFSSNALDLLKFGETINNIKTKVAQEDIVGSDGSYDEDLRYLTKLTVKFIGERGIGVYHFDCLDESRVTFDMDEVRDKTKPIFTSRKDDNDCGFITILAALYRYCNITHRDFPNRTFKASDLTYTINDFRIAKFNSRGYKDTIAYGVLYRYFEYLRACGFIFRHRTKDCLIHSFTFLFNSNSKLDSNKGIPRLRISIFNYCNHIFLCDTANRKENDTRIDNKEYIKQNFIPFVITNHLSDEKLKIDYVKVANECNKFQNTPANGNKNVDYLFLSYDIESANINNKQTVTHIGCIPLYRINGATNFGEYSYYKSWAAFENAIIHYVTQFESLTNSHHIYLGAWNGAGYDFVLNDFTFQLKKLRGAQKNMPVYQVTDKRQIKCIDTMKLTTGRGSLAKACNSFGIENPKMSVDSEYFFDCLTKLHEYKEFDWKPSQDIIERIGDDAYDFEKTLIRYLEYDCRSQAEIVKKFIEQFESMEFIDSYVPITEKDESGKTVVVDYKKDTGVFPLSFSSNAGIAGFVINNKVKQHVDLFDSNILNQYFKQAMIGGRTLMLSQYYHHKADITLDNWNEQKMDMITYVDAVSLYPSAMKLFKYPTKFIKAGKEENPNLQQLIDYADSLEHVDEILTTSEKTYIVKARISNPSGIVTVSSSREKDGLRHGHTQSQERIVDLSGLIQAKYLNKVEIEILEWYEFETGDIFSFVQELFELRLEYKAKKDTVGSDMIKLILNSLYGKCCEKMFESENTSEFRNYGEITNIIDYSGDQLYEYRTFDTSGKLFHIAAFILSNSKWLMNRVIDTLGGNPGNFYGFKEQNHKNQQILNHRNEARFHHPFFSTDTDSMAVYQSDFEKAKEYLKDSAINPNTNELGGFHIDVEAPANADKNYQALIKKAVWICAKTYILECIYVDEETKEIKTFFHRRAKGIPAGWIQQFTCDDYGYLSLLKDKDKRKVLKYAKEMGYKYGNDWRFDVKKAAGIIIKDTDFDRAFPHVSSIGKHRVYNRKIQDEMYTNGQPILLDPIYQ